MGIQSLMEEQFLNGLDSHVSRVYKEGESKEITNGPIDVFTGLQPSKTPNYLVIWNSTGVNGRFLITYGNSIYSD